MGKKKDEAKKERSAVSKERRLALALRSLLDSLDGAAITPEGARGQLVVAEKEAISLLDELGYSDLESIAKRVHRIEEQLKAAVDVGDGKEISRLGLELERAKLGKPPAATRTATATKTAVAAGAGSSSES